MNTEHTSTTIAIALAVGIAILLLFFGPNVLSFFRGGQPITQPEDTTQTGYMTTENAGDTGLGEAPGNSGKPLPTVLTATDITVGTGVAAASGKQVTVNYVGMLPDGTVFDASSRHGQPFTFTLGAGQVIKGWDIGVAGMRVGGKRELIIPADDAYGADGIPGVIPGGATLIFTVELLEVK